MGISIFPLPAEQVAKMVTSVYTGHRDSTLGEQRKHKKKLRFNMLKRPFQRSTRKSLRSDADSIGSHVKPRRHSRVKHGRQRRSIAVLPSGVHIGWKESRAKSIRSFKSNEDIPSKSSKSQQQHVDKGLPATAAVTYDGALAARHARILERIIASGTSIELEELKAKRAVKAKSDTAYDSNRVQPYSVVAPRKVKELKEALLDVDLANGIIGELRAMDVDEDVVISALESDKSSTSSKLGNARPNDAINALEAIAQNGNIESGKGSEQSTLAKHKVKAKPIRVVCLDCVDEDVFKLQKEDATSGARRVKVQTLYSKDREGTLSESQGGAQGKDTEECSSLAPTGMITTAAAAAGGAIGAIGAIGQYLGYKSNESQLSAAHTVAVAPRDEVKTSTATSDHYSGASTTPLGEITEYASEIIDDTKQHNYNEALKDGVRLATAGLEVVQPAVGALVKGVEDNVMAAKKVPDRINKTQDKKSSTGVTKDHISREIPQPSTISAQITAARIVSADERANTSSSVTYSKQKAGKPSTVDAAAVTNFIQAPASTAVVRAADKAGLYDALASATGAAIQHAEGGLEAMQDIKPPGDRMAIFIHWWGFEITLPGPSMTYLSTAHNVSAAFITFLSSMAVTSGAPELLPFIRYISTFMDMEFSAIKSQNHGEGVVVAATWLMPLALVPRPWDYGLEQPTAPTGEAQKPASPAETTPDKGAPDDESKRRQEASQAAPVASLAAGKNEKEIAEASVATKPDSYSQRTLKPRLSPHSPKDDVRKSAKPLVPTRTSSSSSRQV